MTTATRTDSRQSGFSFRPAKREQVGLLFGLAGSSGSGKTYSALRLAKGLAGDRRFAVIDTEAGRALHYADQFDFDHGALNPPFRPDAYAEAIKVADQANYPVIVVDSASHEHAGEGGLLDWHEEELARMAGDDWKKRDAMNMACWVKPKMAHKQFVSRLLQVRAHLILCFRAEEKVEMVRENGKTKVIPKRSLTGLDGWVPISEKNLPYELTISVLLTADQPGIPKPIKLQEQHRPFVPLDRMIGEDTGQALGEWAAGGVKGAVRPPRGTTMLPAETLDALFKARAEAGVDDAWLRAKLKEIGAPEPPQKITRAVIKSLAPAQADLLLTALNSEIDERELF